MKSYQVINNFRQYHDLLGEKVNIIPNYILWLNPGNEKNNFTEPDDNCYSGGKYCSPDIDGFGPLTGADIVKEDLN